MDDLADAFGKLLADMATRATQQALASDPGVAARLRALAGRCIEIQCTLPIATWHLNITRDGIDTVHGAAAAPQVIVRGSGVDLAAWLTPAGSPGRVEISGDDTLLVEVLEILRDFNPDLGEPLGRFLGPDAAARLLGTAELGINALQSMLQGVGRSVQDTATGNFVQQTELESFLSGIDDLRLRVDRLAAKVARHEQHRRNPTPNENP